MESIIDELKNVDASVVRELIHNNHSVDTCITRLIQSNADSILYVQEYIPSNVSIPHNGDILVGFYSEYAQTFDLHKSNNNRGIVCTHTISEKEFVYALQTTVIPIICSSYTTFNINVEKPIYLVWVAMKNEIRHHAYHNLKFRYLDDKEHIMYGTQYLVSTIETDFLKELDECFQRLRHFDIHQFIYLPNFSMKRVNERCDLIRQELMEVIWNPIRLQRQGYFNKIEY